MTSGPLDHPGLSPLFKILNLITSAKSLLPHKVTGSEDQNVGASHCGKLVPGHLRLGRVHS